MCAGLAMLKFMCSFNIKKQIVFEYDSSLIGDTNNNVYLSYMYNIKISRLLSSVGESVRNTGLLYSVECNC